MLVLIAVAIYSYFEADGYRIIIDVGLVVFCLAITAGIIVKLIRARRGGKIRTAFSSVAGAADTYQSLLLGRPTMEDSAEEIAQHVDTDRFTTGP